LIDALVVGIDVSCRVGNAMYPEHYARGWHITSTCGAFGAAAAAAKLMGLDAARTAHAIGIASSEAAGTVDLHEAVVAVSFPAQVDQSSPAVRDFLAVLPAALAIRRSGSTAINLAYIACGRFDGFWVRRIHSWDVAAGLLLVAEAGGSIGPFTGGGDFLLDQPAFISASTPRLLAELQRVLPPWDCGTDGPDAARP
jgi:hypothetical protein